MRGRIDGLWSADPAVICLEEFKCCGELPTQPDSTDLGQLKIYAGLICLAQKQGRDQGDQDFAHDSEKLKNEPGTTPTEKKKEQLSVAIKSFNTLKLILSYVHADTLEEKHFEFEYSPDHCLNMIHWVMLLYLTRIQRHDQRQQQRLEYTGNLEFPYPEYRPSQHAIARRVYQAFKGGQQLLLEAATGSGKTMAIMYPAVLTQTQDAQIFYVTSRNVGALAPLKAVQDLDQQRRAIVVVEIIAKEKACVVEGMPCNPELCRYAAGYYDRVPAAIDALLEEKFVDQHATRKIALAHEVCPFELSLDVATWSDVIVGDYNYVFDPVVRLKRFVGHPNMQLLVDEAHQLSPRVQDMLTVSFSSQYLTQSTTDALPSGQATDNWPDEMTKRKTSIGRALRKIKTRYVEGEHLVDEKLISSLNRAIEKFLESSANYPHEIVQMISLRDLCFACRRWLRADTWAEPINFTTWVAVEYGRVTVTKQCIDPAYYITQILNEHASSIRFSGTTSPLELYQRLHGCVAVDTEANNSIPSLSATTAADIDKADLQSSGTAPAEVTVSEPDIPSAPATTASKQTDTKPLAKPLAKAQEHFAERAQSPFSPSQTRVLVVKDIPTFYKQRRKSAPQLAMLVENIAAAKTGRYLVALPSYEYLELLFDELCNATLTERHGSHQTQALTRKHILRQERGQTLEEQNDLLSQFANLNDGLLLIVSGGIYGESVDFVQAQLSGVVIVGIGLPPPSFERELIAAHFEQVDGPGWGNLVAYSQPALVKNIQAAGRLIRSPNDYGVICLVDSRFQNLSIQRFFPAHWHPTTTVAHQVPKLVSQFWQNPITQS